MNGGGFCEMVSTKSGHVRTRCKLEHVDDYVSYYIGYVQSEEHDTSDSGAMCGGWTTDRDVIWLCELHDSSIVCDWTMDVFQWMGCVMAVEGNDSVLRTSGMMDFSLYIERVTVSPSDVASFRQDMSMQIQDIGVDSNDSMTRFEVVTNGLKSMIDEDSFKLVNDGVSGYEVTLTTRTQSYPCSDLTYLLPVGHEHIDDDIVADRVLGMVDTVVQGINEEYTMSNVQDWQYALPYTSSVFQTLPYSYTIVFVPFTCPIGNHDNCIQTHEVIMFRVQLLPRMTFTTLGTDIVRSGSISMEWVPPVDEWVAMQQASIGPVYSGKYNTDRRFPVDVRDVIVTSSVPYHVPMLELAGTEGTVIYVPSMGAEPSETRVSLEWCHHSWSGKEACSTGDNDIIKTDFDVTMPGCPSNTVYDATRHHCEPRASNFEEYLVLIVLLILLLGVVYMALHVTKLAQRTSMYQKLYKRYTARVLSV